MALEGHGLAACCGAAMRRKDGYRQWKFTSQPEFLQDVKQQGLLGNDCRKVVIASMPFQRERKAVDAFESHG